MAGSYAHVHQLGFVVEDMKAAIREYGAIYKVKKWYRPVNSPQGELFYKGERFEDSGYEMAIGFSGKTEIELITTAAKENIYTGFLRENGPGLHHISFFVKDLDAAVREYEGLGFEVTQNGSINGKSMLTRFAYMTKPGRGYGNIVEFSEVSMGGMKVMRSPANMWFGVLTGNVEVIE